MSTYTQMLREIVRHQGDPENFDVHRVHLTIEQTTTALKNFDHILPEVVGDHLDEACEFLEGRGPSFRSALIGVCQERLFRAMKTDLECTAADMAMQEEEDREFERA